MTDKRIIVRKVEEDDADDLFFMIFDEDPADFNGTDIKENPDYPYIDLMLKEEDTYVAEIDGNIKGFFEILPKQRPEDKTAQCCITVKEEHDSIIPTLVEHLEWHALLNCFNVVSILVDTDKEVTQLKRCGYKTGEVATIKEAVAYNKPPILVKRISNSF